MVLDHTLHRAQAKNHSVEGMEKYTVLEQIMRNTLGYIQMIVVDYMNRPPRSSPLSSTPDSPSTAIL
jgi:hypothetical protein